MKHSLNKISLIKQIFKSFARNKEETNLMMPKNIQHNNNIKKVRQNANIASFDNMDVDELQNYINEVDKRKQTKELDTDLLKKLESKSAKHHLQKTGIFTKSELKELSGNKYIQIKNNKVDLDTKISPLTKIDLKIKNPEKFILPNDIKLFLFFKPKGMICTKKDDKNMKRTTIFDYIKYQHKINSELYCIVN